MKLRKLRKPSLGPLHTRREREKGVSGERGKGRGKGEKETTSFTHPELRLVPVLDEGVHGQRLALGVVPLGGLPQPRELVGVGVALGVEGLERIEGVGGEGALGIVSASTATQKYR